MSDSPLAWYVALEVVLFLGGFAAIIAYRLLTGGINTRYLFYGKRNDGTRYFSPERVQLLVFTLGTAIMYLLKVANSVKAGTPPAQLQLPDIPTVTLAMLGGSHAIFLGGKAYNMLLKKITKGE
jgi:hypothetical protein